MRYGNEGSVLGTWAAACAGGWLVCLPLLGPYGGLVGTVPALLVFSPLWETVGMAIRRRGAPGPRPAWSYLRCLAPRSLAVLVAYGALCGLLLWAAWPVLGTARAAAVLALLIVSVILGAWLSGLAQESARAPRTPSVTRWAVASALVLGASAWAVRKGVLPVTYGVSDVPERRARILELLRDTDRQLQDTVFGPSLPQWYWPLLVAGAGLVAGGVAAALRGLSLTRAPHRTQALRPAGRVFLSYARADGTIARRYVEALKDAGQDVWVDWADIKPSREWREELARAIRGSDALVALISRASLASAYCWDECRQAIEQGKRVLPVLIDDTQDAPAAMDAAGWGELTRFQLLPMRRAEEFEPAVRETVAFVADEHEWVAQHTRLGEQAYAWQHGRHSAALLLRPHELAAAEAWLAHPPTARDFGAAPTAEQVAYVEASRRTLRRRRRGVVLAATASVAALAAVASLVVVTQEDRERQNREELSRTLAQASDSRPYPGMAAAARLAAAAYGEADTASARAAVQRQLQRFQHVGPRLTGEEGAEGRGFSADSSTFAVTVGDRTRIWNVPQWTVRRTVRGVLPHDATRSLSADGARVLVRDGDGRATVVDTRTGRTVSPGADAGTNPWHGGITSDGQRFVTSTGTGGAVIARVDGRGSPLRLADCLEPSLSPHGRYVWCSGEISGTGVLVSVGDGTRVAFPQRPFLQGWTYHDRPAVELWPDGKLTAAQVLDPAGPDGSWTLRRSDGWEDGWEVAAVSPDGTRLALTSIPSTGEVFEIWDIPHRKRLATPTRKALEERGLPSLLDGVDGEEILAALVEAEPVHGMPLAYFDLYDPVLYSPDGRAAAVGTEEGLWAWRLDGWGRMVSRVAASGLVSAETQGSALSPDGRTLAVVTSEDRRLILYDVRTGRRLREAPVAGDAMNVAYSPDGRTVAVGELPGDSYGAQPVQIGLFTASTLRRTATLHSPSSPVYRANLAGLVFSPDGGRLYLGESQYGTVREWSVPERRLIRSYSDPRTANFLDDLALSPDGGTLATADRQHIVTLWNTRTGKVRYRIPEAGSGVAFSPDGRRIVVTGPNDGEAVAVWEVAARRRVGPLLNISTGDGEIARDAVFTPDGRALLVVGLRGETGETIVVRRWESVRQTAPGPVLARLSGEEGQLHAASDGMEVVAPAPGGILRITTDPTRWQRSLCDLAARWLSPKEWQAVAPDQRYPTNCAPPHGP